MCFFLISLIPGIVRSNLHHHLVTNVHLDTWKHDIVDEGYNYSFKIVYNIIQKSAKNLL